MWKYSEVNAYRTISLHDCVTGDVTVNGQDLVLDFPDGFWITPVSPHIDHHTPLKTGPSQLRFKDPIIDRIELFKSTYLFHKPILCRKIDMELPRFLQLINDGKHSLEFLTELHDGMYAHYECDMRKNDRWAKTGCRLDLFVQTIEYYWNEILPDREW